MTYARERADPAWQLAERYLERRVMGETETEAQEYVAANVERNDEYAAFRGKLGPIFAECESRFLNYAPPSDLSANRPIFEFLISVGVDETKAKQAAFAAEIALDRYQSKTSAPISEKTEAVKIHAEKIARAAAKLVEAVQGASDACWAQLEFAQSNPIASPPGPTRFEGIPTLPHDSPKDTLPFSGWRDRVGPRASFEADVRLVRDAARGALKKLKTSGRPAGASGRPAGAKAALVDELAIIWWRAKGKPPTTSGEGDFEAPLSQFGEFVKIVVGSDPDFARGFGGLLTGAGRRLRKKTAVSEPSRKL